MENAKADAMQMMSFRAERALSARVSLYARRNRITRSEAIRLLIERGLK